MNQQTESLVKWDRHHYDLEMLIARLNAAIAAGTQYEFMHTVADPQLLRDALRECKAAERLNTELLSALQTIAASDTVGGISAGERKGLARAAAVARAAIAKAKA